MKKSNAEIVLDKREAELISTLAQTEAALATIRDIRASIADTKRPKSTTTKRKPREKVLATPISNVA